MSYLLSASYVPDTENTHSTRDNGLFNTHRKRESLVSSFINTSWTRKLKPVDVEKFAKHVTIQKVQESEIKVIQIGK